jgi:hypothetical protein
MALTPTVGAMINSHSYSDTVEVAPHDIDARRAVPAIAAIACIVVAFGLWHVVIATALGALR